MSRSAAGQTDLPGTEGLEQQVLTLYGKAEDCQAAEQTIKQAMQVSICLTSECDKLEL